MKNIIETIKSILEKYENLFALITLGWFVFGISWFIIQIIKMCLEVGG